MRVWIDRNACDSNLSACESCFGQFVRTGVPDRGCILATKDDGKEALTIFMHSEDHNEMIVIPPEMREMVAYEGWSKFVSFEPAFTKKVEFRRANG
jgi:hypothetical protein